MSVPTLRLAAALPAQPEQIKDWRADAACIGVDPDLFYPQRGEDTKAPKAICRGCEVRFECLEFALEHGEKFGIWGGESERARRRIRRQRRAAQEVA